MSLQDEIDAGRNTVRSDSLAMSIGELASLYENQELVIRPEFQRLFRWNDHQKARLIESIFLGIPLPSIFVMQNPSGIWEVIDGLQRCSTIFEFMGILRNESTGEILPPAKLSRTKFLPSLDGILYAEGYPESLSTSQRLSFKRSKIDIRVLLPESDDRTKYELFDRLNSGGQQASTQEIRNVQLLLADSSSLTWIQKLSNNEDFSACTAISDAKSEQQYDLDLVCRLIAIWSSTDEELRAMDSVDEYVTNKLQDLLLGDFNKDDFTDTFEKLFSALNSALGDDTFRKYIPSTDGEGKHVRSFSVSAYEAITTGVLHNLTHWAQQPDELRIRIQEMWQDPEFSQNTKAGTRGTTRIATVVPWARSFFE